MIQVFCDVSCRKNGRLGAMGGWAFAIVDADSNSIIASTSGASENTTNNRMELTAFIKAAQYVKEHDIGPVTYFIDSAYVVNAFKENWLNNWISNGWINSKKEEVKNKDLWLELIEALEEEFYQIEKIKGHQNNGNYNDYVDKLAVKASTWLMEKK